ncbi:MAG: hypothetical protein ACI9UA_003531 [Pseudoalteromonas tetraodonis]|jgi:hypothetical protein
MKSFNHCATVRLLLSLLICVFSISLAAADRGPTYRRDFVIDGVAKRLYFKVRLFTEADASDASIEQWKVDMTDWAEAYWRAYEAAGFKSPANKVDEDGVEALEFFFEKAGGESGSAGATGDIRILGRALGPSYVDRGVRGVIGHEMFHSVQFRYDGINQRYLNTFREGTAVLALELVDEEISQFLATNSSCATGYLTYPGGQMWFRPGGANNANVCHTALWWKYLTQQFSDMDPLDYQNGLDTLLRLLEHLETPTGWRQAATDVVAGVGDFDGDNLDDLLVRSSQYIGTVSPMFFNPDTIAVVANGGRFGGGWKFDVTDEVLGIADLGGDRKPEMVIRSATHLGIIGTDDDGNFVTLHAVAHGNRLGAGGWLTMVDDTVVGIGDFDGDGESEICLRSSTHLGLIDYSPSTGLSTRAVLPVTARFGTGWLFQSTDSFVGTGDFNGDGVADLAIKSGTHYGFVSYDPVAGAFETLAAKPSGSSVAAGWSIAVTDNFLGVGRLGSSAVDSLVVQTSAGIAAVSAPSLNVMDLTASINYSNLGLEFQTVAAIADMDGDGRDELVTQLNDGGIRVFEKGITQAFSLIASMTTGQVLRDGYNGEDSRQSWTVGSGYQVQASGDFDGDSRDEIVLRSGNTTLTLHLNGSSDFNLGTKVVDGGRYDSLLSKLESFIHAESSGARNLHSIFNDFTVANYANSLDWEGVDVRYRYNDTLTYPNAINYDHRSTTSPVVFSLDETVGGPFSQSRTQEPWTVHYYNLSSQGDGLQLDIQTAFGTENAVFTLLVEREGELIRLDQYEGAGLEEWVSLGGDEQLILIVTTFEAPLQYSLQWESTTFRVISIEAIDLDPETAGISHVDITWESVSEALYVVDHVGALGEQWLPVASASGKEGRTSYQDQNLGRVSGSTGFYRIRRIE